MPKASKQAEETASQTIAAKMRARANTMTDEERDQSLAFAMRYLLH